MAYKPRRAARRNAKTHGVKRRGAAKSRAVSSFFLAKRAGTEGMRKVKRYIKKALDFGIESGYLRPSDSTFKLLRVSSDLLGGKTIRHADKCGGVCSHDRERTPHRSPARFDEYEVQDRRRRRRRRRGRGRSRSGSRRRRRRSRRRGRKRSGSHPEEVGEEGEDDYDMDTGEDKRIARNDDADRDKKPVRPNPADNEKTVVKRDDEGSDLSADDDDETDDEDEKKRSNPVKP